MAQHVIDNLRDRGAILGPGVAARAKPIAQESIRGQLGFIQEENTSRAPKNFRWQDHNLRMRAAGINGAN